jgi:hypothetical protein
MSLPKMHFLRTDRDNLKQQLALHPVAFKSGSWTTVILRKPCLFPAGGTLLKPCPVHPTQTTRQRESKSGDLMNSNLSPL